jgi:hypothetical protein
VPRNTKSLTVTDPGRRGECHVVLRLPRLVPLVVALPHVWCLGARRHSRHIPDCRWQLRLHQKHQQLPDQSIRRGPSCPGTYEFVTDCGSDDDIGEKLGDELGAR